MAVPEIQESVAIKYPGTGPQHDPGRPHIFVVVAEDKDKGDILIVPVESYYLQCDETCVILTTDGWGEIKNKSFVGYYQMKKVYKPNVIRRMEEGDITYLGQVPDELYARIKRGVTQSLDTEPVFLRSFEEMNR